MANSSADENYNDNCYEHSDALCEVLEERMTREELRTKFKDK